MPASTFFACKFFNASSFALFAACNSCLRVVPFCSALASLLLMSFNSCLAWAKLDCNFFTSEVLLTLANSALAVFKVATALSFSVFAALYAFCFLSNSALAAVVSTVALLKSIS